MVRIRCSDARNKPLKQTSSCVNIATPVGLFYKILLCVSILMAFFTGCTRVNGTFIYLPCASTLYKIDLQTNEILWNHVFGDTIISCTQDEEEVYVGIDDGEIYALSADSGEVSWSTDSSLNWTIVSGMQFIDDNLYYSGPYDPSNSTYSLCMLSLTSGEETRLPISHTQLSNFSVYDSHIYTHSDLGVVMYDLETGEFSVYEIADSNYQFLYFYEDMLAIAYNDRVEWYTITSFDMTQSSVITADSLGLEAFTVCSISTSAFVFMARNVGESFDSAMLCAYLVETASLVQCEKLEKEPSDIVFTPDGFYAAWENQITYYDWHGGKTAVLERAVAN